MYGKWNKTVSNYFLPDLFVMLNEIATEDFLNALYKHLLENTMPAIDDDETLFSLIEFKKQNYKGLSGLFAFVKDYIKNGKFKHALSIVELT